MSEITHDKLIEVGAKWLKSQHSSGDNKSLSSVFRHSGCGVILKEFVSFEVSIPDVIGFNNHCSVVIECKVSHEDYIADLKKDHRAVDNLKQCGNYRYYLTLPEIIKPEEIKNGWGLLYYDGKVHIVKAPDYHNEPEIKVAEYSILYSVVRRASDKNQLEEILKPYRFCDSCHRVVHEWKFIKYKGNLCLDCLNGIGLTVGKS